MYILGMKNLNLCLNLEIRKANRVLSQLYDAYLQPFGLKTSQFSILRAILFLNNETTNSELKSLLVLDQTSLSRALRPLIRDQIITVKTASDRRQKVLSLSADGMRLFEQAEQQWEIAQQRVSDQLGGDVKKNLLNTTRAIISLKR